MVFLVIFHSTRHKPSLWMRMFLTWVVTAVSAELPMSREIDSGKPESLLPADFMSVKCRPRSRLIGSVLKENFEYVSAQMGSSVVLQCGFCNEESSTVPKTWYYSSREYGPNLNTNVELELGMHDEEGKNHFFQRPDYSLAINNVVPSDSGYYYCHGTGGEEAEFRFNFMVDVIYGTTGVVAGNRNDWKAYKSDVYPQLKRTLAEKMLFAKDHNGHKHEFYFHVLPEWTPWSNCDGCVGMRSKMAECKLIPTPASNIKGNVEERKMAAVPRTVSTTPMPPGNHSKLRYLLYEHAVACQSQDFFEASPEIFDLTKEVKTFVLIESCVATCTYPRRLNQPKFKNTITLQEGDHIKLVCPESSVSSAVEWKKDGLLIDRQAAPDGTDHILVDTFSNLYITYARDVESGGYSCYVDGEQIQEVIVTVNAEAISRHAAFLRHMHYLGFMLMFGVIFYIAGIIVAWTQRHSFTIIDFDEMDKEENEGNLQPGMCRPMNEYERKKEFALKRMMEEKFVHI